MSNVLVTIVSVQPNAQITKRDGGTYTGLKLVYESGGRTVEKAIHKSILEKNPALMAKLVALQPGQEVGLALEKNGNFTNITDVVPASQAEAAPVSSYSKTSNFKRPAQGGGSDPKDVARIARQVAVQAAATAADESRSIVSVAEELAAFILKPLGVDSMGNKLSSTETVRNTVQTDTQTTNEFPF